MSIDHIKHGLHIADIESVQSESTQTFDLVVSVCQDTAEDNVGCEYEHYPLADDAESQRNWGGTTDYETFADAAVSVVAALRDDSVENVLVHCHRGRNRSAALCVAAIGAYEGSGYLQPFYVVETARPIVEPNHLMKSHAYRFIEDHT